jgi:hypothetical protein
MRRAVVVSSIGLTVVVVLVWFVPWGMAVVAGWDAAVLPGSDGTGARSMMPPGVVAHELF